MSALLFENLEAHRLVSRCGGLRVWSATNTRESDKFGSSKRRGVLVVGGFRSLSPLLLIKLTDVGVRCETHLDAVGRIALFAECHPRDARLAQVLSSKRVPEVFFVRRGFTQDTAERKTSRSLLRLRDV